MRNLDTIKEMVRKYGSAAVFVIVYIEEAHPSDGWMIDTQKYKIYQHKELDDRLKAAALLNKELQGLSAHFLVDYMSNEANLAYGAVPERFVVLENGVIKFISGKGPFNFGKDLVKLEKKLQQMKTE